MLYTRDQSGTKYFPLLWIFFLIGVSDCGRHVREKGSKGLPEVSDISTQRKIDGS